MQYKALNVDSGIIRILRAGLLEVTTSGTGRKSNNFGVNVAGKTGTAQNTQGDDHAWFAGYAPAEKPRYAVVAIAEAGKAGSSVTGPIVGKMLNYLVNGEKFTEPQTENKQ